MLVKFYWRDIDGLNSSEEWDLPSIPRIGDYVHLDKGTHQGTVTMVTWLLNTLSRPVYKAQVFLDGADKPASREDSR